jgi:hypothetical protein
MFIKEIRAFIKRSILLFLLAAALIILANSLIQGPYVQKKMLERISNAIGYDIEAKGIEIDLWKGIGLSINDLSARSKQGDRRFSASNVSMTLDVRQLLAGRIVPSNFYLTEPTIEIPWKKEYSLDPELKRFLPEKIPLFWFLGVHSLVIEQGHVIFTGASFNLENFNLRAVRINASPASEFMIISRGQIGFKGEKAGFRINGKVTPPVNDSDPMLVDVKVKTDKAPLNWFRWPASIPVKDGYFKTRLDIEGDPTDHLSMKGLIDVERLEFELVRRDKRKVFSVPEITIDFQSVVRGDNIDVRPLKLRGDDLSIDLGFAFDLQKAGGPFLDLNFKSEFMEVETFKSLFPSPLLPLWLETRLFPMFTDGDIKVNNFGLKGKIDQIRHMKMPENQSVMEMLFECRGFEASGCGIQPPFKDLTAEIALKDGCFSVSGIKAVFGESAIKDAEVNIRDIFSVSRLYEILMDGDFDIKGLLSQKNMEVIPVKAARFVDKWPAIGGRMKCRTVIGYQKPWCCPRILNGDFLLNGVSLDYKGFIFPVKLDEASIHIEDSDSDYVSGSGSWGNNSFNISANFGIAGMTPYFKDGLLSSDMDMDQIFSVFNLKDKTPLIFSETLPLNVSLAKEGKDWSLKGRVDLGDTVVRSGDFEVKSSGGFKDIIDFELGIKPSENRIDIDKALLRLKDSSINMTGIYDLQTKGFIDVNLNSSLLVLKDISVALDKREVFYSGALKGDLNISMPQEEGAGPLITGLLEGTDLSFQPGRNLPLISNCSFQLDFSGKGASINYCNITAGKSGFSITGDIREWKGIQGEMKVSSDYLDFMDILGTEETPSSKIVIDNLNLLIHMDVSKGQWRKFAFGPAKADLVFENENLFIKDVQVHLGNGDLALKGHILKVPAPEMLFTGDIHIRNQPVDELMEEMDIAYKGLKGDISIDGSLSVKGSEEKDLVSGLNGSLDVSITKGLIKNPNVFIKVMDFLSIQKIFEQRPPDLREAGMFFESISGDAVIEDGILQSDNFVMRSPILNAVASGKADIPRKNADFIIGIQPHGMIDSFISKVPVLGYIIAGENKSIVAYPFEVKGPFSDPDVKFVPFDTFEGGMKGIVKRIFLTPGRLVDKLKKALNGSAEKSVP